MRVASDPIEPASPKIAVVEAAPAEQKKLFSARFVKENKAEDGAVKKEYIGGMPFNKSYTLVNDGEHPWPVGVNLVQKLKQS